jgi:hypothetical protein
MCYRRSVTAKRDGKKALPAYVDNIIRDHGLFGYGPHKDSGKKEKVI